MKTSVFGTVTSQIQAENIFSKLSTAGFTQSDLSILYSDSATPRDFAVGNSTKAPEGAVAGGLTGGTVGAIAGWLVGLGALAIPGVGPFIAAGPILAALSGTAIGASVGSLAGALTGLGFTELEAQQYEGKLKQGSALISAHCETSAEVARAKEIFQQEGASDICSTSEVSVPRK